VKDGFATLSDDQLDYALRQLDLRLAYLRAAQTAIAQALHRQFSAKRAAVVEEIQRRKAPR
jgi:hypothetical protein